MEPDQAPPPTVEPEKEEDYIQKGWTAHVQGDFAHSEEDFHKALSLNPQSIEANYGLGMSFKIQGRIQEALEAFQKTLETIKANPDSDDPARITMLRHLSQTQIGIINNGYTQEPAP